MTILLSRRWLIGAGGMATALALAGCTKLGTLNGLNAITPGDGGTERAATGIAFGSDPRQMLDVYTPDGAKNAPVIVFFYGGSWASGRRQDYAFAARALAARGFVVVVPDYRLVPQVRYPAFVEDGAAAVAWTVANVSKYGGDPARIGVSGHSAGGYIAMMLTLDQRWLAKAGAASAIKACATLAGPFDFAPFEPGGAAEAAFGQAPDIHDTQPIAHARAGAPPLLLMTGADDTTVYPRNSERLLAAQTALGTTVSMKTYPGIGHIGIILALSKPFRGKAPALADTAAFMHQVLG